MSYALLFGLLGFTIGSLCTIMAYMLLLTSSGVEITFPEDRRNAR